MFIFEVVVSLFGRGCFTGILWGWVPAPSFGACRVGYSIGCDTELCGPFLCGGISGEDLYPKAQPIGL